MFPFDSHSPQIKSIAWLFNLEIIIAGVIILLIAVGIAVAALRYRYHPGDPEPPQIAGNRWLEITWTAVPFLILVVLFGYTVNVMAASDPESAKDVPPDMVIVGHQWWWEIRYPKANVFTANEIHLPVGQRLLVQLEASDVVHSFWIPSIARKVDLIPGQPRRLWIEASEVGEYAGTCAEFCGTQHARMRLSLLAQSSAEFENWLTEQAKPPSDVLSQEASKGENLYETRTCGNCHALVGIPKESRIGPDLGHVASRRTLAANLVDNTPENLAAWLSDPQSLKPGTLMPNFQFTNEEVQQLVAYLETLK